MSLKNKIFKYTIFTGTVANFIHILNQFVYHTSTLDNLLKNDSENYYSWTYGKIFYTKQGSGSPILLIHDLDVCSSHYEWYKIKNELSKTNTVYTLDLLGCGLSEKPNLTYTNFLYVQLITDFIQDIIKDKTDIISTGYSSIFSLISCMSSGNDIKKVILVNPENLIDSSKVPKHSDKLYRNLLCFPIIGTLIYNIKNSKKAIDEKFHLNYFYDHKKILEKDILTYVEASQTEKAHGRYLYGNIKSGYTNANPLNCLSKIENKIYIIIGNGNPENNLAANQYQHKMPSIQISGIDNTKHLPQMELPKEFIEHVKRILES